MSSPLLAQDAQPVNQEHLVRHAFENGETFVWRAEGISSPQVAFDVSGFLPQVAEVKNGSAEYQFDTSLLRSGDYDVRSQSLANDKPVGNASTFHISIAPPRNLQRMPVWNWFMGESPNLDWWKARGFNGFRLGVVTDPLPEGSTARNYGRILDDSTRMGLDMGAYLYPTLSKQWADEDETTHRLLKVSGERDDKKPYPLDPTVMQYGQQVAQSWVDKYAPYPAWKHALLSSEYYVPFVLNETAVAEAKRDIDLDLRDFFKKEYAVTEEGQTYAAFDPAKLPTRWQAKDGLIEDDNPVYRLLQWWWKRGNGLAPLNAAMAQTIHAKRPDVLTWHDPYRLAPVYGSHAGLDIISTWTYGHPDIKRLSYATVLQAAARPANQLVMPNITLFVYKRFVQPVGDSTANLQMDSPGDDPYFTQGPDYTREAIWLTLAQRPDLLSFYFGGSLSPDKPNLDPAVTSPETFDAIGEVSRSLIEPYGPALLQTKRQKARVAVLMSAAATWFHAPEQDGGYSNEMVLPFCSLLMMNHVPFEIILDDDIAAGRLSEFDALVIPRGDSLRRSDYTKIQAFAQSGKTVIADSSLRAPIAGAKVVSLDFSFQSSLDGKKLAAGKAITAEEFRTDNEALAAQLKPLVEPLATSATADTPRVLLSTLESGRVRYVFAVNDNKTYGPRFGPWKLMQELGLRQGTKITIPGANGAIYDALLRSPVEANEGTFDTTLPASRGKLFAVLPEKIGKVELIISKTGQRGQKIEFSARVLGVSGQLIEGAVPLQIEIFDANGDRSPISRFGATVENGGQWTLSQKLALALNDADGTWMIRVTELLSGSKTEAKISVT